jgi:GNAT superfamily N-acetyltransferase
MTMFHGTNQDARPGRLARPCGSPATAVLALRAADSGDLLPLNFFFDAFLRRDYFVRRGQLAEMLRGRRHRVLIAEFDGVLVGVAVVTRAVRLVNVLIHPAYRGLGIGRALLRESGAHEVRAKTDMSTGDPRAFYAALGFVPTGERCGRGNIEIMRLRDAGMPRSGTSAATEAGAGSVGNLDSLPNSKPTQGGPHCDRHANDDNHAAPAGPRRRRPANACARADRGAAAPGGEVAAA